MPGFLSHKSEIIWDLSYSCNGWDLHAKSLTLMSSQNVSSVWKPLILIWLMRSEGFTIILVNLLGSNAFYEKTLQIQDNEPNERVNLCLNFWLCFVRLTDMQNIPCMICENLVSLQNCSRNDYSASVRLSPDPTFKFCF